MKHGGFEHLLVKTQHAKFWMLLSMWAGPVAMILLYFVFPKLFPNADLETGGGGFASLVLLSYSTIFLEYALKIVAATFFVRWFCAAFRNARTLSPNAQLPNHNYVLWCWFIPIKNLYRPYLAMKQLIRKDPEGSAVIGAWWAIWLTQAPPINTLLYYLTSTTMPYPFSNAGPPIGAMLYLTSGYLLFSLMQRINVSQEIAYGEMVSPTVTEMSEVPVVNEPSAIQERKIIEPTKQK